MDAQAVAGIDGRLRMIAAEHRVAIPLAIESGSRAWGFPSPDSDYDCRFIFVRTVEDYLSLFAKRDVIEMPLEGELDVNGWDVAKALRLMLKGNAVVIEWLTSPIVYAADPWFRDEFLALARRWAIRERIARHYLHLGERQRKAYFADRKRVEMKKIFYALRPAAALRWLRLHKHESIAPMHFPALMEECDPPSEVRAIVLELTAKKALTRELGVEFLPAPVSQFIDAEFAAAREAFAEEVPAVAEEAKTEAERFFHSVLSRLSRSGDNSTRNSGASS
ncbi:MAG TPA: nucleotidyltransferase domain-containing protein [Rhizomicrobium sp.]|jgi:predicted nucleotidyltransferase